jgi:hypothetical protein
MRLKGYSLAAALILLFSASASGQVSTSQCTVYTHHVTQGYDYKGLIKFGGIDLDPTMTGIQSTFQTAPGGMVRAQARWIFGTACPECRLYVNVFGSWEQGREIAKLYSGQMGAASSITLATFFINAPETEGEHTLRVIFSMGAGYADDFQATNLKTKCRGEQHIFFMEGVLRVSGESVDLEILSPRPEAGVGIAKIPLGAPVVVNASIRGNASGMELFIDGKKVSDKLPYTWSTVNETVGLHLIAVEAFTNTTRVRKEIRVELSNVSFTAVDAHPIVEWVNEFGVGLRAAALSGDGRFIVAAADDAIYVYHSTGRLAWRKTYKGIKNVAVSGDGSALAAASDKVIIYLSDSGHALWNATFSGGISAIAVTPSGRTAVASGGVIHFFGADGSPIWNTSLGEDITALSTPGDGYIAASSKNRIFLLSNQSTLQWSYPVPGELKALSSTASGMVAAATNKEAVLIYEGVLTRSFSVTDAVGIGVSSDGALVVVGGGNSIQLYRDGALIWSMATEGPVGGVFLSGDASEVLYTDDRSIVMLQGGLKGGDAAIGGVKIWVIALAVIAAVAAGLILRARKIKPIEKPQPVTQEKKEVSIELEPVSEGLKMLGEGSLLVHVLNSRTKKPVIKAKVFLNGRSKETDEEGKAVFEEVTRGRYRIRVNRKFYQPVEAEHLFRGPEEQIRLELSPRIGLREEHTERLKAALEEVKRSYGAVAHLDTCLPGYLKSVAENIVDFVETSSDIPGDSYEDAIEYMVATAEKVCGELGEVILDWRNVRLYEVGGKAEGECRAKSFGDHEKLEKAVSDPGKFVENNLPQLRRRLELLDGEITGMIGELTITPLAGIWKIAEGLVLDALSVSSRGNEKAMLRASMELIFADSILGCMEEMLGMEDVLERLRHPIL